MNFFGPPAPFAFVEAAVADIAAGKLVIVTDDQDRVNEGDLIMAASRAVGVDGSGLEIVEQAPI